MGIHPTAIIDKTAELGTGVSVGPWALVGPRVVLGDDTEILAHAVIEKDTILGKSCRVYPFACLGTDPQDTKYAGEPTQLIIGDNVTVRESATIHRGTVNGGGATRIGNGCLIMATCHIAHDCHLDDEVILSSFAVLAGHVSLGFSATVSGSSAIHQFVRVGMHAFIGGMSGIVKDVPPYMIIAGLRDKMMLSPNLVGLKRKGFSPEAVKAITLAHRLLHNHKPLQGVLDEVLEKCGDSPEARHIVGFYRASERGVYR
ncbi:MAG: acyl-ACP--UDP-N-acetylglucosamine O-acyltransferase [Deltaproteobacteria bacterium]|jgi:UDP-N-acetylglucosamine acyltransferase|nr:acyl-ACP--UDP-N-acetylglucosamine O-acyltransferase [Deltaproteobacteria bacterium]